MAGRLTSKKPSMSKQTSMYSSFSSVDELGFVNRYVTNAKDKRSLYQTHQELSSLSSKSQTKSQNSQQTKNDCDLDTETNLCVDKHMEGCTKGTANMELLLRAQSVQNLINHKLDLIAKSIKYLDATSSDMCHQAITNSDTELPTVCPSHRICNKEETLLKGVKLTTLEQSLCDADKFQQCQELGKKLGRYDDCVRVCK